MKKGISAKGCSKTMVMVGLLAVLLVSLGSLLFMKGGREGFKEGNMSLTSSQISSAVDDLKNAKKNIIETKKLDTSTPNIDNAINDLNEIQTNITNKTTVPQDLINHTKNTITTAKNYMSSKGYKSTSNLDDVLKNL